jgi:1-acyl-sn-glycerol-3-phosphate acyltransferase
VSIRPSALQAAMTTEAGHRFARAIAERFRATLHGAEHVPRHGGALLVGNHTMFGMDAVVLAALLAADVGRLPRWLGERILWKLPGTHTLLEALGAVPGAPEDAVRLLRAGELVAVYPGGVDDSFKPSSEAYELKWGRRAGFARVALRAGVPVVPVAATGIDELYGIHRHERLLGRFLFGSSRYDLPLPANLRPRDVALDFHVLPAIEATGDADDPGAVERVREAAHAALEGVLAPYRAEHRARSR